MDALADRIRFAADERWTAGSTAHLDRAVARGALVRIARGAYVDASAWTAAEPAQRHRALVAAAAKRLEGPVFCAESAAVLHGIPILGAWPPRASVLSGRTGPASSAELRRDRRGRPWDEVRLPDGHRATSPLRTAIDLAATRSLLGGIVAVSDVRRRFGVGLDAFRDELLRLGAFRGAARARSAVERSCDGSDSPLETLVVVRCQDLGFEIPEQQVVVATSAGVFRCDFGWSGGTVIGEADGRLKYEGTAQEDPSEIVWREKRREDAIREVRPRFLRIGWGDAWHGAALERRLVRFGVARLRRARALTY